MPHTLLKNRTFSLFFVAAAALLQAANCGAQAEKSDLADGQRSQPPNEYTLEYAQGTFDRFYETGHYIEATDAGKLVIELLLEQEDYDKMHWSRALTQLAYAQGKSGETDTAILNLKAAVDMIEQESDRLNSDLVDPLLGLSRTYTDANELDSATETYKRALHVNQVNSGVHNFGQAEILVEMSEVYFQLGDFSQANTLQESYFNLASHKYPGDNLLKLPAMYSRADMLTRTDKNVKSQKVYRRIIGIIERVEGSRSLTLLPALYKLSDVFLFNEILDGYNGSDQARRYVRRAVYLTRKNDDATNLQKAEAHIAMGNFFILKTADRAAAMRSYQKAWDWLSADDNLLAKRDQLFAEPVPLSRVSAQKPSAIRDLLANAADNTPKNGSVVVQYDVDQKGRARNMRVIESKPSGYKDNIVKSHLRNLVFRPRFVDREPAESRDRRFEIRFSYRDEN